MSPNGSECQSFVERFCLIQRQTMRHASRIGRRNNISGHESDPASKVISKGFAEVIVTLEIGP